MITRRIASSSQPSGSLARGLWTCPSCTRSSFTTSQNKKPAPLQRIQRRTLHNVVPLPYGETFEREGVPGLFSPKGYSIAWTGYQTHIIERLNDLVTGDSIENDSCKTLILKFARDPMNAAVFNYASASYNNHQFFKTLASAPLPLWKAPAMQKSLENTFGSIETLKYTMLDTAAAMFGPGYVWLVWAKDTESRVGSRGAWRILTTYLSGTPYPEAGYRQQGLDMSSNNASSLQEYMRTQQVANTAGFAGPYSQAGQKQAALPPGGTSVMPVLCVSTWEHSYLYDYGQNKRKYLENWWDCVDWGVVESTTPMEAKGQGVELMSPRWNQPEVR